MTLLHLARCGYGSVAELDGLDTPDYLDMVEYEQMRHDIEAYQMQQARIDGHGSR